MVQFPYQNDGGVYHYPTALMEEMEQYMTENLPLIFRQSGFSGGRNKERIHGAV